MKTFLANLKHLFTHDLAEAHKRSDTSISTVADRTTTLLWRVKALEDKYQGDVQAAVKKDKKQ